MTIMPPTSFPPLPTPAELEILQLLWQRGPSTVRELHTLLEEERGSGYTTVLKILQIMYGKGLVTRDESGRSHVYSAAAPRDRTQRRLVNDLAERAFGGSATRLALRALSGRAATTQELDEVRRLLDEMEAEREGETP